MVPGTTRFNLLSDGEDEVVSLNWTYIEDGDLLVFSYLCTLAPR